MNNSIDDISAVIEGCKRGERLAQEKLYRSFYGAMMNICVRYTQSEADALEVMNTGFYKVFKNIHTYRQDKATFYTWVRIIIINTCLNFIRSKEKVVTGEAADDAAAIQPGIIASMQAEDILRLVRLLPPATQAVFNLYVMDGYTHKDIATMLQVSEGTSKWHLSEARKILQKQLKQYMP